MILKVVGWDAVYIVPSNVRVANGSFFFNLGKLFMYCIMLEVSIRMQVSGSRTD